MQGKRLSLGNSGHHSGSKNFQEGLRAHLGASSCTFHFPSVASTDTSSGSQLFSSEPASRAKSAQQASLGGMCLPLQLQTLAPELAVSSSWQTLILETKACMPSMHTSITHKVHVPVIYLNMRTCAHAYCSYICVLTCSQACLSSLYTCLSFYFPSNSELLQWDQITEIELVGDSKELVHWVLQQPAIKAATSSGS